MNDIKNMKKQTLPVMLQTSFYKYKNNKALSFVGENFKTYGDLKFEVEKLGTQLREIGVRKGTKVAVLSENMPNWGVAYFAIGCVGAIVVPILPDFHSTEISNILKLVEAEVIFVSKPLRRKINNTEFPSLKIIGMEDFHMEKEEVYDNLSAKKSCENFQYEDVDEEDLLSIIYTSGTTGKSKGVMLTHKNIVWTTEQCKSLQDVNETDRFLSVLPLSHTLENTLCLNLPIMYGASVYYLKKAPTPAVLLPALKKVKPTFMLLVPLIIEKIFSRKVLPEINKNQIIKNLYKIRFFQKFINKMAGNKLYEVFGGHLRFFGIGGARLDVRVERFLMDTKFPLAIGYGLTETSPLLAGTVGDDVRLLSTGIPLKGVKLRIANADPVTGEGEVQAFGKNVMKGYYKEPELTARVFTEDGWFRTGDRGKFDSSGFLYLKGRIKNMIVGSSGENIYPEEIESVINRMQYVMESLVVEQKGRLVAMVHLNMEDIELRYKQMKEETVQKVNAQIDQILQEIQQHVNEQVNKFSRIQMVVLQPVPFEKTPTHKIKRFLYL